MAIYPVGVKTFTTKNPGEIIQAGHVNDVQDEVTAIESNLKSGVQHNLVPDGDVTRTLGSDLQRWLFPAGSAAAPGVPVGEGDCGLYRPSADQIALVAGGVASLVAVAPGVVHLPAQYRAFCLATAIQTLTTGIATAVQWNAQEAVLGLSHSPTVNNHKIIVPAGAAGVYVCTAFVTFNPAAGGERLIQWASAGTGINGTEVRHPGSSTIQSLCSTVILTLTAGMEISVNAYQSSGAGLTINNAQVSRLQMMKVA